MYTVSQKSATKHSFITVTNVGRFSKIISLLHSTRNLQQNSMHQFFDSPCILQLGLPIQVINLQLHDVQPQQNVALWCSTYKRDD